MSDVDWDRVEQLLGVHEKLLGYPKLKLLATAVAADLDEMEANLAPEPEVKPEPEAEAEPDNQPTSRRA